MLHIITWLWGSKYGPEYVDRLRSGVTKHLTLLHRFVVVSPEPEDIYLTEIPGCFARLRTFDPGWQQRNGIQVGDQIVCMDLDSIVTGSLNEMFLCVGSFAILQGCNRHKFRFNGSIWSLTAGYCPDIWSNFSLEAAAKIPFAEFPDDQQYIEARLGYEPSVWMVGPASGIYAVGKPAWPGGSDLPRDARLVVFPGRRDPSHFLHFPWVRQHWLGEAA